MVPTTFTEPWRVAWESDCAVPVSAARWTIWEGRNNRSTASQSGAWVTSPVNNRTDDGRSIARTSAVHLRVQDVHHSDVVAGFDETARERRPNESCPTSDEHGC